MLKRINRSLYILNDKNERIIVMVDKDGWIVGDYEISGRVNGLVGDASKIYGFVYGLTGDVSNIEGNVSNIRGDVSSIEGNVGGIEGDVSDIEGSVTGISGDVTGVSGDVDEAIQWFLKKNNLTELKCRIYVGLLIG